MAVRIYLVNGESVEVDGTVDEVHDKLNAPDPWVRFSEHLVVWPAHVTHIATLKKGMTSY